MVVYIEFAFAENFLVDGLLLCLSVLASGARLRWVRLAFAAALGAVFAVVFPLLVLPAALSYALKFAVAFLMCLIAFGRVKGKKEWGRYAFTCVFFFVFTFAFGGALTGAWWDTQSDPAPLFVWLGLTVLACISLVLIRKLHEKRALNAFLYDCTVINGEKRANVRGFLDSGNTASRNGLPVCFLSPDVFYELWGEELLNGQGGQVCDEMCISTVAGEKKARLYKGLLALGKKGALSEAKEVYFSPTANMVKREYKLLIPARIFEKTAEKGKQRKK